MMKCTVTIERHPDCVVEVRFAHGPANTLDVELLGLIADALTECGDDPQCRAIVLCAEGKHFCAGAELAPEQGAAPAFSDVDGLYEQALRIFRAPTPTVGVVQGSAIGGGLGLALACDFRIAASDARFSANFARLGFHHGFALTATLPRAVGHQAAAELLFTGRRIDAGTAHSLGLCDDVAPREGAEQLAHSLAAEIAGSAPLAVQAIRETLRVGFIEEVESALFRERVHQLRLVATQDFREGVGASAERRAARFVGA